MSNNILEIPKKIYVKASTVANVSIGNACSMFVRNKMVKGDVEYTLLNAIWRKPSEKPKKYPSDILVRSDYGKGTRLDYEVESRRYESQEDFVDWGECTNSIAWCYIADILPKGGLK